jgi:hypothetical protein
LVLGGEYFLALSHNEGFSQAQKRGNKVSRVIDMQISFKKEKEI